MTANHRAQDERRFDDERSVDALLAEGGFPGDTELRNLLLEFRAFRSAEVPQPSPELAALMGFPPAEAPSPVEGLVRLEDWNRKHPKTKRVAFTTLAVAVSLGIAGGAAAGNDALRRQAEGTISNIVRSFSPPARPTPAPPAQSEAPTPLPAVVPPLSEAPPAAGLPTSQPPAPVQVHGPGLSAGERTETAEAPDAGPQEFPGSGRRPPSTISGTGGNPAEAPAGPAVVPSKAGQPPAGKPDSPGSGRANGKADVSRQDAGSSPHPADVPPRGR
ncbi:hypothetical protein FBY31_3749 [Arthrobacter sp. SLBN-100]|uniref:hypothetical protein n=1 Tax=Arthrobacter sp. SLBN-100 TaxID=2768450 RepID=UPI00114F7A47|nr:hypothetical protein [Arthrobacter sp. SLBN-100]TQJ69596.1 hypothetical protein FBY31_3749 [Arthrobacter sp. SLBN-100]